MIARDDHDLIVREVTPNDSDLLLRWRNDPDTRAQSRDSRRVKRRDHEQWLAEMLVTADCHLYLIERAGTPVGTVRMDWTGDRYEVSWTVAPEARGSGVGKWMVRAVCDRYNEPMMAEIRSGNERSVVIARFAGFEYIHTQGDMMVFEKPTR